MQVITAAEVLAFWFDPANIPKHFAEDEAFDDLIRQKFLATWELGSEGLLTEWRTETRGRLAEIIILDQFSRNMFRGDIRTYAQDKMAIVLAQELLRQPQYDQLTTMERRFALLPFMHSESIALHLWARPHFVNLGDEATLYFEEKHLDILKRFGRYPYQNAELRRVSTSEELAYLLERDGNYFGD